MECSLTEPVSAARALLSGSTHIERPDHLVRDAAAQRGMQNDEVDRVVELVDRWLSRNRAAGS